MWEDLLMDPTYYPGPARNMMILEDNHKRVDP